MGSGDVYKRQVRNVLENLQANRALAGDDIGVVVRMNKDEIFRSRNFVGEGLSITDRFALKDDAGAKITCSDDLRKGGPLRHDDGRGNTQTLRVISDALRMVTGGNCDNAFTAFLGD